MSPFEAIRHEDENGEYWSARELLVMLDYASWQKFKAVIQDAMKACENSGQAAPDHFNRQDKMITIGKGGQRAVEDYHLSRYACYLIVQNADPEKPIVALGQTYFASQTRAAELTQDQERIYLPEQVAEHNKTLAASAYEVGVVTSRDFAIFNDHGYVGLYAGERAKDIVARKDLAKGERILDWMGTEELADNLFRQQVRRFIIEELEGTPPEDLPTPAESVQQVKAREQKSIEAQCTLNLWGEEQG
jgi:DNA-damage-inducible protein D